MFKEVLTLFDSEKPANCAWVFGCTALGIAAVTGMAWTHCGLASENQKCRVSGGAIDTCAAEKGEGK